MRLPTVPDHITTIFLHDFTSSTHSVEYGLYNLTCVDVNSDILKKPKNATNIAAHITHFSSFLLEELNNLKWINLRISGVTGDRFGFEVPSLDTVLCQVLPTINV